MTTFELYRKHKSGEISREKFLYEVRRDNNLPWITNLTSYNDAITILKNKGIVTDETPAIVNIPAIGLMTEAKEAKKELTLDTVNPYEYRHGLQYELNELGEYTDEALEKAKATVLKNLNKDANFYSSLLNQKQSTYFFKKPETDEKGMQANADGTLKKGAGKVEKANVQDSLGKKEEGSKKPKGVKVMPDKGVTGSEKTIKEGSFMGGVDLGASFEKMKGGMNAEDEFESLVKKYDWYAEMSDDPRKWNAQQSMEADLRQLSKTIGVDKAVEIFNRYAPSDRKVTSSDTMWGMNEDKHAKIKEALKSALKKEGKVEDELAKKSAVQTEKAKLVALNKQKSELQADTTKAPQVKDAERKQIDLKIRSASDTLNKLNQGKIDVV